MSRREYVLAWSVFAFGGSRIIYGVAQPNRDWWAAASGLVFAAAGLAMIAIGNLPPADNATQARISTPLPRPAAAIRASLHQARVSTRRRVYFGFFLVIWSSGRFWFAVAVVQRRWWIAFSQAVWIVSLATFGWASTASWVEAR
jgi:hypothetical protein